MDVCTGSLPAQHLSIGLYHEYFVTVFWCGDANIIAMLEDGF